MNRFDIGIYCKEIWYNIGIFDKHEVLSFKTNNTLLWEARASARMTAYVILVDKVLQ